ncbi:MAG: hypothetical protein JKY19_11725 [Alcanivoracaceae bacterium]|nr:hypothetical protein [Alcanivoracaceae bacterium]
MTNKLQYRTLFFLILAVFNVFADDLRTANQIDYTNYFLADIRDAEECSMDYVDGKFVFSDLISNPSITCPDMFSWKLFMQSIDDRFWSRWADEFQNWPSEPYQLCSEGGTPGVNCCQPGASNNPKGHCPVFPGNQHKAQLLKLDKASNKTGEAQALKEEVIRVGIPSIVEHAAGFNVDLNALSNRFKASKSISMALPECSQSVIDTLVPKTYESIGRVIRQTNAEVTVRDEVFHNYLFENNLYNATGVMNVFNRNAKNLKMTIEGVNFSNAPYHIKNRSANRKNPNAHLASVDLPSKSIMIKSNWIHKNLAKMLNMKVDSANPYISKTLQTTINIPGTDHQCAWRGEHYLVAFHISSKDIPQWVWTTFEHVYLPGRCDITGCNDSYGYKSPDKLPKGVFDNFVTPHQKSDHLNNPSIVFNRDLLYKVEQARSQLTDILKKVGIGTGESTSVHEPDAHDKGWLSYRLKGSQVEFTDLMGRRTLLGNSVTEAGFMDGSSCVTCHARAGINISDGKPNFFKLSVFDLRLSDYGYAKSVDGIPNQDWFHNSDMPPSLDVLQTDFIWGFLFAKEIVHTGKGE